MAKQIELRIEEACKHPECFIYVWANNSFLNAINPQYAKIIRVKRANQQKVLMLSANKYLGGYDKVTEYYTAIEKSFEEMYGMNPFNALVVLAQGGTVAGKNWSEGVYGIGALHTNTFTGVSVDGGGNVTVDAATGHILYNGKDITDTNKTVYADVKGTTMPYQLFGTDDFGYVYMSQYNKTYKKYFAESYTDDSGTQHKAKNGKVVNGSESSNIWGNIELNWDWIKNILNWILSLFGVPTIPNLDTNTETLSTTNTLPNQQTDGFVSQAGVGGTGVILLAAAAAGYLLMGNKGKSKKSK